MNIISISNAKGEEHQHFTDREGKGLLESIRTARLMARILLGTPSDEPLSIKVQAWQENDAVNAR